MRKKIDRSLATSGFSTANSIIVGFEYTYDAVGKIVEEICIFVNDVRPKKQEKTKGREKRRERRICGEKERGTERSGGANERTPQGGGSAGMRF